MATVEDLQRQIMSLDPAQAAQLADWIVIAVPRNRQVARGIEVDPRVCGGDPRIARTRIPVWTLEEARRLGASEATLLLDFPSLRAEDLVNAWNYVARHREEIEEQILANDLT